MLILYFSWDGLRGKCLGFWVYLEVKTVGTAVPASATELVQEVKTSVTAQTAKEVLAQIETAYKSHTELAAGVKVAGDTYEVSEEDVLDALKADENVKSLFNDWEVEISDRESEYV